MYELIKAGEKSWYIDCPAKIGVYEADGGGVYLIDSGSDKDAGRRVRQILDKNGWKLKGIMNTHSNADHIGGNRYLQNQTGCPIFAGGIEAAFTRYPVLEPSFLYGGYPCRDLRHKFLLAQESEVQTFESTEFPGEIEVLPLPGHFFDMTGFGLPDGTVFLADCLSSRETLEKYGIPFIYDVEAYLATLDKVCRMQAGLFVPSHAPAVENIRPLAEFNRGKVLEIADRILELCSTPAAFEEVLQGMFRQYGLAMNFEQYVLVGSTVRSYLSWLRDTDRLEVRFEDGRMLWEKI